jgi:hypothetical protein
VLITCTDTKLVLTNEGFIRLRLRGLHQSGEKLEAECQQVQVISNLHKHREAGGPQKSPDPDDHQQLTQLIQSLDVTEHFVLKLSRRSD